VAGLLRDRDDVGEEVGPPGGRRGDTTSSARESENEVVAEIAPHVEREVEAPAPHAADSAPELAQCTWRVVVAAPRDAEPQHLVDERSYPVHLVRGRVCGERDVRAWVVPSEGFKHRRAHDEVT
jgi:hypothetical protein